MSPVSFMGSKRNLEVKQESRDELRSEREGSALDGESGSLGKADSAQQKHI
jgi:hypothetical protein